MNTEITVEKAIEKYPMLSSAIVEGIFRYANEYCPTGGFLKAVLTNNLKESFMRADENNQEHMYYVVMLCYWEIPSPCWGSEEKYNLWIKRRFEKESEVSHE